MRFMVIAVILAFGSTSIAQIEPVNVGKMGYLAEVVGNDVYVRSGPSTNYYPVAKLSAGARVRVFVDKNGWLAIEPPAGCYSLIHKNFVDLDPDETEGVVNGDQVLVRAGSDMSPHLYAKQRKLNRGATVKVLRSHNDDYLRIVPPKGVRVYIASQFVHRLPASLMVESQDTPTPASTEGGLREEPRTAGETSTAEASGPALDSEKDEASEAPDRPRIAAIEAVLEAEEQKPLVERDYERVIARFRELAEQREDTYARSYAKLRLAQLRDAADTVSMVTEVRALGEEMASDRKAAMMERERMRPPLPVIGGGFDAVGELRKSMIYASKAFPRRYRLVDVDGVRTIGYVEIPRDSAIEVERFLGRKVGVRARGTRLQTEDVDPLMIFVASELVLLDAGAK
ncbi:MAG: hypothetical protein V3W34_17560 [Phycisphaerae bacterium]